MCARSGRIRYPSGAPQQPHVLHFWLCQTPIPRDIPSSEDKRTFLQKLAEFIHPGPDSTDELIETLAEAEDNQIINAE